VPLYGFLILLAGWIFWLLPFLRAKRSREPAVQQDRRARWGIALQAVAYALVWMNPWVLRDPGPVRIVLAMMFFSVAGLLSWSSVQSLGKQWRIEAGLNENHELVRSGAYRVVRHPIYASMLAMFLGTGLMVGIWPLFAVGLLLFVIGIEIRIGIEDQLLATRFGREFTDYRDRVSAYLPGIR